MRVTSLLPALFLFGCSANPRMKDLDCPPALGACSASLDPIGYEWYLNTNTDCAVVTMDTGERLPVCGHRRLLGEAREYGIQSCKACVRHAR